jgi:hypothetical protein
MITVGDVRDFGTSFFNAVASGASAAEQAQFFLDPHARIYAASGELKFVLYINIFHHFLPDSAPLDL